jgi:hypothetical protein
LVLWLCCCRRGGARPSHAALDASVLRGRCVRTTPLVACARSWCWTRTWSCWRCRPTSWPACWATCLACCRMATTGPPSWGSRRQTSLTRGHWST